MDSETHSSSYEEIEQYIRDVSHELKEPLQEIALYSKAIEKDSGKFLLPQSQKDLQAIQEICRNTIDMIQLFLKYTSINSIAIRREIIPMEPFISQCFASLTKALSQRRIMLETETLPNIIGDRFLFQQLVTNILSNSIKFTQDNAQARIRVYAYAAEEMTSYCFEDNGIGFDNKYAAKAFNIFERIHLDSRIAGNGIGLALVKNIVNRFGGEIEIFAKENEGCTVTVKLPNKMVIPLKKQQQLQQAKKDKITIGIIGACSGSYANIAPCRRHAYELAAAEINAAGGILGKQIQLIYRDFHSDLSLVSELVWELAAVEQADVLMGGQLSSARETIREVADEMKIPYFFNALYEGGLADHYTFCISAVPEQNIYPILDYLFQRCGRKCYIIAADYNYGVLTSERVKDYIEKKGGIIGGIEYFSVNKDDFDSTVVNIKKVNPDILISFCVSENQNNFYKCWYENGIPGIPLISTIGIGLSYLHRLSEPPVMENTYFMSSYIEELQTPQARRFTAAMRKFQPKQHIPYIEFDAETAYTSVYLYKNAVEMAGTTETEAVISALESGQTAFHGPGGCVRVRGEDHHVVRDEYLFRVNAKHQIETLQFFAGLSSNFVEQAIYQETGQTGGLKQFTAKNAPNVQYNMIFHRIL